MSGLNNIYNYLNSVASIPNVRLTQLENLRFKIVLGGELMDTYFQLGKIQTGLRSVCEDNGYVLRTVFGDGQDAVFEIKVNREKL